MTAAQCLPPDEAGLAHAVSLLRAGQLVAFPTETVYGLGADAGQPEAVRQIFQVKGRPADHPVIVHIAEGADPLLWAAEWPPLARQLADTFWPGPLTLIVKRRAGVSDLVTGGQDTVGLRCPAHPVALALLKAFGGGIAAPSANRFGRISPTCAGHVLEELGDRIDLVIDGGDAPVGIESTIIDVSRGYPVLLRPGDLCATDIERVIGQRLARPDAQAPRVSGSLDSHYAPQRGLQLVAAPALPDWLSTLSLTGAQPVALLAWTDEVIRAADALGMRCMAADALQAAESLADIPAAGVCIALPGDPHALAHHLYAALRWADHLPVRSIVAELPPASAQWEGIADRLRRAAAGH